MARSLQGLGHRNGGEVGDNTRKLLHPSRGVCGSSSSLGGEVGDVVVQEAVVGRVKVGVGEVDNKDVVVDSKERDYEADDAIRKLVDVGVGVLEQNEEVGAEENDGRYVVLEEVVCFS